MIESEEVINEPMMINEDGVRTLVDKENYLSNHERFKLALDENGKLIETEDGMEFFAPKGTKFEDLEVNEKNQVVVANK